MISKTEFANALSTVKNHILKCFPIQLWLGMVWGGSTDVYGHRQLVAKQ